MDTSKTFETEGASLLAQSDGMIAYTAAGDMKLDLRRQHTGAFNFPSCHYHGLTVAFDLDIISHSLSDEVKDFPVTPAEIITRFSLGSYPRVLHKVAETEHIFSEMYRVPEKIRIPYFKVKILELLLYLDAMTIPVDEEEHPYFYRTQVEKVKAIKRFLAEHLSENYTQEELSRRFDIPMTPMKTCFRSVYGEAIGTWLAGYRMNQAAELLLRERDLSIAEIGSRVGYDNAGKFTVAFKKIMKLTPSEYRRERGITYEKKAAQCEEFIAKLTQGYDTPAGEAGKRLSGGEKQRIAIARMMLKNAPIVILDEATTFTDPENEEKIQRSIAALTKGKTLLVIAHRLSTIRNADKIVVLKNGNIVAEGSQEQLLDTCPLYRDMWQAHIGAKNWAVSSAEKEA